jgi:hypothetical protein
MPGKEQSRSVDNTEILAHARVTREEFYTQTFKLVKDFPFSPHQPPVPHIRTPAPLTRGRGPYADLGRRIRLNDHVQADTWGD